MTALAHALGHACGQAGRVVQRHDVQRNGIALALRGVDQAELGRVWKTVSLANGVRASISAAARARLQARARLGALLRVGHVLQVRAHAGPRSQIRGRPQDAFAHQGAVQRGFACAIGACQQVKPEWRRHGCGGFSGCETGFLHHFAHALRQRALGLCGQQTGGQGAHRCRGLCVRCGFVLLDGGAGLLHAQACVLTIWPSVAQYSIWLATERRMGSAAWRACSTRDWGV